MSQVNVFSNVRNQIVNNEINKLKGVDVTDVFKIRGKYPENIIVWMTSKAKAFKVDKITKEFDNGTTIYNIQYKNLNLDSEFLAPAYEKEEYKVNKYKKSHEFDHLSVVDKAMATNDKYRMELDCPNFDYERFDMQNEYLEKADSTSFELFLQKIGFKNYDEFTQYIDITKQDIAETIDEMYKEFEEQELQARYYPDGTEILGMEY